MPAAIAIEESLRSIVGPEYLREADASDIVAGQRPSFVVEPANERELADVLHAANEAGLSVIPRGGGTKLSWGNPPTRANLILSTARLNKIIEHVWSDLTVSVEAGCTVQFLQSALAKHGQRLAIDPLFPQHATVGGMLSTNDSGSLRLRFGALRDLIIGITLALPDGTLASSGGKVVKNVAGYDLPKLATGALGTLGVITRAVFRVHPLPPESTTLTCLARDLAEAKRLLHVIQDSKLAHSALQLRSVPEIPNLQLDILFEATQAGIAAQTEKLRALVAPALVTQSNSSVWSARKELFAMVSDARQDSAVIKISVPPAEITETLSAISNATNDLLQVNAVFQATGIGWLVFKGKVQSIFTVLQSLRPAIEGASGSLVLANRPTSFPAFDTWGNPGDALPLMRAVKSRLDPRSTLNPGRFVGGI
jgi:glycolate oxidase FAD binding subunit